MCGELHTTSIVTQACLYRAKARFDFLALHVNKGNRLTCCMYVLASVGTPLPCPTTFFYFRQLTRRYIA